MNQAHKLTCTILKTVYGALECNLVHESINWQGFMWDLQAHLIFTDPSRMLLLWENCMTFTCSLTFTYGKYFASRWSAHGLFQVHLTWGCEAQSSNSFFPFSAPVSTPSSLILLNTTFFLPHLPVTFIFASIFWKHFTILWHYLNHDAHFKP